MDKNNALISGENLEIDKGKPIDEQAKQIIDILTTRKALENEGLGQSLVDNKIEELKQNSEKQLKAGQVENKKAEKELQEADYGVFNGVATYAGIKKPLPLKYQKFLFVLLMIIQVPFQIIFGSVTSVITICADCIDTVVGKLSSIAKSARVLVLSIIVLALIIGAIYIISNLLKQYNLLA